MLKFLLITVVVLLLTSCSNLSNKKRDGVARANTNLGLYYLKHNQPKMAKSKLLFAYQKAPRDPVVCDALGYLFSKTGEIAEAERYYLLAIKIADNKSRFRHNYGQFLYSKKSYQEALQLFLLVIKDVNYLHIAEAYADAAQAALMLHQEELSRRLNSEAIFRKRASTIGKSRIQYEANLTVGGI